VLDLQKRIRDLEAEVEDLRNNPPELPAGVQQQLRALEQGQQDLTQRLQAIELHLRQSGTAGAGSTAGGDEPAAGAGGLAVPQAIAPQNGRSTGSGSNACSVGGCRMVWTPVYDGCGCGRYVLRPVCGAAPLIAVEAPDANGNPAASDVEPAPAPDVDPATLAPAPEARRLGTGAGQFSISSSEPVIPEPIDLTGLTARDAGRFYTTGYNLFWQGDYAEARRQFDAAATLRTNDARIVYYRGLTEAALGQSHDAEESVSHAARLELAAGQSRDVSAALERLQGRQRMWLEAIRAAAQR
jgi:TolA-binding protein